ncbi:MAG: PP2C family serine/threonine-protein phosphatase [bacterium]|nr:PP2C family serine/threonine-protein phosphatase [bacterium]
MRKKLFVTCAHERGPRSYQEDKYVNIVFLNSNCNCRLLAVMDGHVGSKVADICADKIGSLFNLENAEHTETALQNLVIDLNKVTSDCFEGSTLSMACIQEDQSKVSIAILGDSPVVVLDNSGQLHISPEHNVRSNLKEREAAIGRGGTYAQGYIFANNDFTNGLQMSRALGDAYLGNVISHEPEIYTINNPMWILVSSDGIFDPNHSELETLFAEIREFAERHASAQDIMNWAKSRGLQDNATALVWRK